MPYLGTYPPLESSHLTGLHHIRIVHARVLLHKHLLCLALLLLLHLLDALLLKVCL